MVSKVRCWIGWLIFSLDSSNELSEYRLDVYSGVPQGGVLRQVLFIQYVNDLPDVLASSCMMFANDTKVNNDA